MDLTENYFTIVSCTYIKKFTDTFFRFFLPKLMLHLYSSIDEAAVQKKKNYIIFTRIAYLYAM